MAETSKNKIYYNDNENSVADVLADMKKMAESTDEAIENSKYNDAQIKKDISNIQKEQTTQNTDISNIKKEQETQDTNIEQLQENTETSSNKIAELEKELKEAQEDFYQASVRGQASGEYIHVEDSSGARCKIGISGNSEQETNLYNGGLELGSINNTGEVSASNRVRTIKTIEVKENTKIKVSANGADEFLLVTYNSNKEFQNTTSWADLGTSVTIPTGIKYIRIVLRKKDNSSITSSNITNFVVGDTPSLDYPSPVKTVGSNVNIFDKDNTDIKNWYIDTSNKKIASGNSENRILIQEIKPNTTYTISKKLSTFIVATCTNMPTLNSSTTQAQRNDNATKITIASGSSDKYLVVQFKTQADTLTEQEILDSIKIVEGTEVGEYSKYGQGSVKVTKCNKNLINKNLLTNYQILEDTGKLLSNNTRLITPFIYLKKGTYSLSCNLSRFAYAIYNLDKSFNCFVTWKAFPNQIVLNSDCYIKIEFIINPTGSEQVSIKDITYLQLEKGNTTNYEEHEEQSYIMPIQQPMRSIGDIRDTFIKKENKWYERHYVQRLILNGTEGWNYDKNNNRFYFAKAGNKGSGYIMSSHYLRGDTTKQNNTCEIWSSAILFRDERFTEREDFKNMIKAKYDEGIPVYVDYVSITPTDIECTEEQSQILDELTNARTYKNVTNITTDSKAILSLDYVKDLETLLTSKESEV